ncbi:MAG: zeta toxin [Candidatus Delongbacteria bacterium]|nr:zeta toxin [Candidatus Delongbacteria bacterium]
MRKLYIIAGPNGAGKTTASYTILPEIFKCKEFINADEIARGISPFNPDRVAIQAGKIMLRRINELLDGNITFAIETTLAAKNLIKYIHKAKEKEYEIILLFLNLDSEELAIKRVETRVKEGGHNIPKETIIRRYKNGLKNFFQIYVQVVDKWIMVDNSDKVFHFIAEGFKKEVYVTDEKKWENLIREYDEKK